MSKAVITKIPFLLLLVCSLSVAKAQTCENFYRATDDVFVYMGRIKVSAESVEYNWPGVTVLSAFTGQKLGIKIKGGQRNYFNVWVDNMAEEVIHAVNDTVWWYPGKLSKGLHQLRIVKRTEGGMGTAEFSGIYVCKKEIAQKPAPLPVRKMIFIGNSITCGYGTEGKDKLERFKPATENCEKSYAPIIARAFASQYQLISHSGLGMVRNYNDKDSISTRLAPMPARLEYLLDEDSTLTYNLHDYIPDVVVINLGTNDFSTHPFPPVNSFIEAGKELVRKIKKEFPETKIVCVTGPMINEPCFSYTKKMVEELRQEMNTADIVFVGIPQNLLNAGKDLGSDWHPSYYGQLKTAQMIVPVLSTLLGWDYSPDEILQQGNE